MINDKYKLIALDLDGTLLNPMMKLTDFTWDSLIKIYKRGYKLSIISSRGLTDIQNIIKDLPVDYIGALDGAVIFDNLNKQLIEYSPINDIHIKELVENLLKYNFIAFNLFTVDNVYISRFSNNEFVKHYQDTLNPRLIGDFTFKNAGCIHIIIEKKNKFKQIFNKFSKSFKNITFKNAGFNFIIANKKGIDKGVAIKNISEAIKIPLKNIIAIGDSGADIHLLKPVGLGVAMKNGSKELKTHADKITEIDNNSDGAVRFLLKELCI